MERSDKQRKPVAIKNLSELKRFIQPGVEFKTLSQKNHPDLVGLTRVVTTVQTVCFYSKIKDQPNSRFSTDNGGKGFRTDFAKADAYIFDGTTVKVKDTRNKDRGVIYEFEFYDREQTIQEDTNMDRKMVNFISPVPVSVSVPWRIPMPPLLPAPRVRWTSWMTSVRST